MDVVEEAAIVDADEHDVGEAPPPEATEGKRRSSKKSEVSALFLMMWRGTPLAVAHGVLNAALQIIDRRSRSWRAMHAFIR